MRRATVIAALAVLAALPAALPVTAQQEEFGHCGDIQLVFMNPDLRPRDDGLVHVSGTFYIQFQAIGPEASRVAAIGYSFGKPLPDPVVSCDAPGEPLLLAGIHNYRLDSSPEDGFFVPINSTNVPDGEYAASIVAYDAGGAYLSAFYAKAVTENGPNCRTDRVCADHTQPWPIILPGDGAQSNEGGGITIEFGEFVADVAVKVNGVQVIPEAWVPPARDDDLQPENDEEDCGPLQDLVVVNLCHKTVWGSGFRVPATPQDGDVIEVKAIDTSGNEATKIVTVGGATQGGAIALVEPEVTLAAEATELEVEAGQTGEFRLKLLNVGSGDAEVRLTLQAPEGVASEWSQPTVTIPAGGEQAVLLKATPAQDKAPGAYTLLAKATYKSGTADAERSLGLGLKVTDYRPVPESPLRRARANLTAEDAGEDAAREAPGPAAVAVAAGIGAAAMLESRRRRR